jgi:hypothetical protein
MNKHKTVFKWWWGWNPEKIERWIEDQESQGWNLVEVSCIGTVFRFQEGPKRRIACRIDYQGQPGFDHEYLNLFGDAGWTLIHQTQGWYFWKQAYTDVKPEIFTDTQSLIDRNRRQMRLLGILSVAQIPLVLNLVSGALKGNMPGFYRLWLPFHLTIIGMMLSILITYVYHNRRLKKSSNKQV